MSKEDEFPPYGPVPIEKRRPLRHWKPESHPLERPMLSQPITSYKLLNRSTEREKPERAAGDKNRLSRARLDAGPTRQRMSPPAVDELIREIDEEESNKLNVADGYNPTPPRPREGLGLQLRPQHPDNYFMEYFSGPAYYDPRGIRRSHPYLEVVESCPIPPSIIKKPKPKVRSEIGEKVDRPPPPKGDIPPKVYRAKNILFEGYSLYQWKKKAPAEFSGEGYLAEIQHVVDILQDNPRGKVRIRASVGWDAPVRPVPFFLDEEDIKDWTIQTMTGRGQAVANQLRARGIDPKRITIELGNVGRGDENKKVEFIFDIPAP